MRTRILKFANFIVFGEVPCVAGLLFSTYSLAQVIALPLLGRLADHIGRRPVPLSCFQAEKHLLGLRLVLSLFGAAAGAFLQGAKLCQKSIDARHGPDAWHPFPWPHCQRLLWCRRCRAA